MSILTGDEPRGRVVLNIANHALPGAGAVEIIRRELLGHVAMWRAEPSNQGYFIKWGETHDQESSIRTFIDAFDDAVAIYKSIVEEDVDVIWTCDANKQWTRVPHAPGEELKK